MDSKNRERFPRRCRIVRRADFRSLYNDGKRVGCTCFVLFGRENDLSHHRLGITVSRKVGNAVVRNRVKRLLREVFRKSAADIPRHYDFVVNAKRSCAEASYNDLRREFLSAASIICR